MLRKILFVAMISILAASANVGVLFGAYRIGLPDNNAVTLGADYIAVPASVSNEDMEIKAMTFNIRCFTKESDKQNYWDNRKEHVSALVRQYAPDVVGFQEVTHPQYKYLISALGDEYAFVGISRSGIGLERGDLLIDSISPKVNIFNRLFSSIISEAAVIFYKKSRFELLEYDTLWLSETPSKPSRGWDAGVKRICNRVKLKDHYSGAEFTLMNTHFDNKGALAKEKSVELILQWSEQADKVIVMGDFNIQEKTQLYTRLVSDTLSDTKYLAPEGDSDSGITSNGYGASKDSEAIDYILVKSDQVEVLSYSIIRDKYGSGYYISDHYPVLARIIFKQ